MKFLITTLLSLSLLATTVPSALAGHSASKVHRLSIQFDYRFADGFFDSPERRAVFEDAASLWGQLLTTDLPTTPSGTKTWVLDGEAETWRSVVLEEDVDDVLIFVFASPGGAKAAKATGSPYGAPWSRIVPASYHRSGAIWINTEAARPWFFDQTPMNDDDLPSGTHYDFFSTALHEIGHAMGLIRHEANAFSSLVHADKFHGPAAMRYNGGEAIPLEPNSSHMLAGYNLGLTRPHLDRFCMHGSDVVAGFRNFPRELDALMMEDVGYELHPRGIEYLRRLSEGKSSRFLARGRVGGPRPSGLWWLGRGDTPGVASVGAPLRFMPNAHGERFKRLSDGIRIPTGAYILMDHGLAADAGRRYVNRYAFVMDVRVQEATRWVSLYNTNMRNGNDGEAFISPSRYLGYGDYSDVTLVPNHWHRVAVVVDLLQGWRRFYIDGLEVHTQALAGVDGRYSLDPVTLLFADDDGNDGPVDVRAIAAYQGALSRGEIAQIGSADRVLTRPRNQSMGTVGR